MPAGKPVEVKVAGKKNTVTFHDVLLGEVWVCSGQSNMQMTVKSAANAQHEIADATHLQIRLFTVPMKTSPKPMGDVEAYWNECTPYSVPNFSAVAYYFGTYLHGQLGVPIGLIDTSWGGTRIEPWTPPAGFHAVPAVTSILTNLEKHPPVVAPPVKSKKGKKRAQGRCSRLRLTCITR